jgi:predicted nucleotidyltransferase
MTTKSIRNDPILEALFTSQARVEVLKLFFLRSSNRHYLREIAALTDQPIRAIQRELARLESAQILQSSRDGNRKYFRVNLDSPIFTDLRALLMKTAGIGEIVRKELQKQAHSIQAAFIFGSFAQGMESSTSDVDLLVIGGITGRDLSLLLSQAKELLGREFNPIVMRTEELQNKVRDEDPFIENVLHAPKIFLIGGEDEFAQLAGRRAP